MSLTWLHLASPYKGLATYRQNLTLPLELLLVSDHKVPVARNKSLLSSKRNVVSETYAWLLAVVVLFLLSATG